MIFGIGTDIVEVARIKLALERQGNAFAERILSPAEYHTFLEKNASATFLAKRFAAKEAAAKAFGSGFRDGLSLQHIEVKNDRQGRPSLNFYARAKNLVSINQITNVQLSLADEKDYAIAFVTLEQSNSPIDDSA